MPRTRRIISRSKDGTGVELVTNLFHYRVTLPNGRVNFLDEAALVETKGAIGLDSYSVVSLDGADVPCLIEIVERWKKATPEERLAFVLMGEKVEEGEYQKSYEMDVDYS